ncbi:2OG-Fe(II) oxygenase [Pseudomonas sp. LB3P31]
MMLDVERLDETCIKKLANEDILALRIKGLLPSALAIEIGSKILAPGFEGYINAPSIGRIGMAFYEAENRAVLVEDYFERASRNITELRNRCAPYASPVDTLRCMLDESWPAGAHLENLYGRKMYVGLSRVVEPGVCFLAHHDIFAKDAPHSFQARSLEAQFAGNVYLNMPSEGGELQIWNHDISADQFDEMRGDCYGIDPSLLGAPTLQIRPEPGDFILFNSRCMHSVTPGILAPRLSLSFFVGYRGTASPLTFWS